MQLVKSTSDPLTTRNGFSRATQRYLDDLVFLQRRPDTIRFYRNILDHFAWWLDAQAAPSDPAQITDGVIKRFLVYVRTCPARWGSATPMATHPTRPATEHAYARALRAFFNWCVGEELVAVNPLIGPNPQRPRVPMPRVPDPGIAPLAQGEVERLLGQCDPATVWGARDAAIIWSLLDSGWRAAELCGLRLTDYDADTGAWRLASAKTGHVRAGLLAPPARRAVKAWLVNWRPLYPDAPDRLFLGLRSTGAAPLTPNGLGQILASRARAAGVPGVHPHRFRHTYACMYLTAGGDPASLQMLLGHSTLKMTMRYLHLTEAQLAAKQTQFAPAQRIDLGAVARARRGAAGGDHRPRPTWGAALPRPEQRCAYCDKPIDPQRLRNHPDQRFCNSGCYQANRMQPKHKTE